MQNATVDIGTRVPNPIYIKYRFLKTFSNF